MQLNDGPHGAWAGACRTSSGLTPGGGGVRQALRNYHMTILHSSLHKYIHIVRELHCILRYICIYT